MKYAFKMMAVVLALGVLVLQGCNTQKYSSSDGKRWGRFGPPPTSVVSVSDPTKNIKKNS